MKPVILAAATALIGLNAQAELIRLSCDGHYDARLLEGINTPQQPPLWEEEASDQVVVIDLDNYTVRLPSAPAGLNVTYEILLESEAEFLFMYVGEDAQFASGDISRFTGEIEAQALKLHDSGGTEATTFRGMCKKMRALF